MCTRVVYTAGDQRVITARSMDWAERMDTEIWLFPRGMERHGAAGPASCEWKSQYGSVVTSAYDSVSTDGMNEAGLVANMLWLTESQYPVLDGSAPTLSLAAWAQYVLDRIKHPRVTDKVV